MLPILTHAFWRTRPKPHRAPTRKPGARTAKTARARRPYRGPMTVAPAPPVIARAAAAPTVPDPAALTPRPSGRLAFALPAVSLIATADMALPAGAIRPASAWTALLLLLAVVTAATGRRRGATHLAMEPLAMALMVVLGALHGHPAAATADVHATHGGGWLAPVLAVSVAALSVACLATAIRTARARGLLRASLPLASATAMCAMTAAMLLR